MQLIVSRSLTIRNDLRIFSKGYRAISLKMYCASVCDIKIWYLEMFKIHQNWLYYIQGIWHPLRKTYGATSQTYMLRLTSNPNF